MTFPGDIVVLPSKDPGLFDLADGLRALAAELEAAAGEDRPRLAQIIAGGDCMASHALENIPPPAAAGSALAADHIETRLAILAGDFDLMPMERSLRTIHSSLFRAGSFVPGGPDRRDAIGAWRRNHVAVNDHEAPNPITVPGLIEHVFRDVPPRDPIAAAALHHRLCWIHPFADGNGRTIRLHTTMLLHQTGLAADLWSLSVGLAGDRDGYHAALARADWPRQSMMDGRGALSDSGLRLFCRYLLDTAAMEMERMLRLCRDRDFRQAAEHSMADAIGMTISA